MAVSRNSILFLPLLAIISSPLWWSTVGDLLRPRGDFNHHPPPVTDQLKTFVLADVLLTQYKDSRKDFQLKAARVNSGIHENLLEMEKIEARLIGLDGMATIVTGGEGLYRSDQQILTVIYDVLVKRPDGMEIRTEALRYLSKYRKVKTAEEVTIAGDKVRLIGGNMFYDLVDGNFRAGGGVKVDLY